MANILAAAIIKPSLRRPNVRSAMLALFAVAGLVLALVKRPDWLNYVGEDGYWFLQSWKALPSLCLGIALALWLVDRPLDKLGTPLIGAAGLALTAVTLGEQWVNGYSRSLRTLSGFGWLLIALAPWRARILPVLARLGRHSYGIYLVHVLFVQGAQAIIHRAGQPVSPSMDILTVTVAMAGAIGTTWLLAQSRYTRWLAV